MRMCCGPVRRETMLERRRVLQGLSSVLAFSAPGLVLRPASPAELPFLTFGLPAGEYGSAVLDQLPGKKPLIRLSYRPPNYETPISYFSSPMTANDVFFVRYHLADIPEQIELRNWRLQVGGDGAANPFDLTVEDLQSGFEQVEITAVCQCSGNRRGLSDPHVPGVQWGPGAMGNAAWAGVRLKDVLAKAGLRKEAVEIVVNGADGPVNDKTPDFVKSIPIWKALDDHRPPDERRAAATFQWLPCAAGRAGLDRHLLDEASGYDRSRDKTFWRLLDEKRLPHPQRQIPDHRALSVAGERYDDTD